MYSFICWISFLILSSGLHSFANTDTNFNGSLSVSEGIYYLHPEGERQKLQIRVSDPLVRARLNCLKQGDNLSGMASSSSDNSITIRSIDYVGLNDLLGIWNSNNEVYKFVSVRNFYFWSYVNDNMGYKGPFSYNYALSPYGDDPTPCKWKVFIVNPTRVVMGSLQWSSDQRLAIELYDPDTGEISATKTLTKTNISKIKELNLPKQPVLNEVWKP